MICPHCDSNIADNLEVCPICKQRFQEFIDFESPLEKLRNIGNRMIRRDIPADPAYFPKLFSNIEEQVQEVLDRATSVIEKNILDLERLRKEAEKTGMDIGDLDLDSFNSALKEFSTAQTELSAGLKSVKLNLVDARTSDEITKGLSAYSEAMSIISEALGRIETLTYETADPRTLTSPPDYRDLPKEVYRSRSQLEKAIKGLDAFEENEDPNFINYTLLKIERAYQLLLESRQSLGREEFNEEPADEEMEFEEEDSEDYFEDEEEEELSSEDLELDDEELIELIYRDVEEIVSEEDIRELTPTKEQLEYLESRGYEDIYKDEDWHIAKNETIVFKGLRAYEPDENMESEPVSEQIDETMEEEEEENPLVQRFNSLFRV